MYDVMYNCFFNKKSFFSLFFIFIFFNVFSQNLNKKINDNPKFLKLIELSKNELQQNSLVVETIDKKAYLSALSLAKYICVMCDSTSMISEAALTGKPIYVADIPTNKNDQRIRKFRELFSKLTIIKKLDNSLESWDYERLDETSRIANEIKKQLS